MSDPTTGPATTGTGATEPATTGPATTGTGASGTGPTRARRAGRRAARRRTVLVQLACVTVTLFMGLPVYLIALAALSSRESLDRFPLALVPSDPSVETMRVFLSSTGIAGGFQNSVEVGLLSLALSLGLGVPAGYALARYAFPGRDPYQLFLLLIRALPIVVLAVPLARVFLFTGLYDTTYAVALVHTALALPTTVLITSAVFVSVPVEHEEAARVFGATPARAFARVVLPQALPGIAAAAIFTFVTSWNEVFGAAVLTLNRRTLPAQVLSTLSESPLAYRFAGGFALVVPALIFIAFMRRYLLNMWGTTIR